MENATAWRPTKAALDGRMSKERASKSRQNLTVDFSRRGSRRAKQALCRLSMQRFRVRLRSANACRTSGDEKSWPARVMLERDE